MNFDNTFNDKLAKKPHKKGNKKNANNNTEGYKAGGKLYVELFQRCKCKGIKAHRSGSTKYNNDAVKSFKSEKKTEKQSQKQSSTETDEKYHCHFFKVYDTRVKECTEGNKKEGDGGIACNFKEGVNRHG